MERILSSTKKKKKKKKNTHTQQGRIQDFFKEGAPKFRTDRTLVPVGTEVSERDVPPLKRRKNGNFQS